MGLFQPGWMSGDYRKAARALRRVTRQAVLCRAAREAPDMRIRKEAVERLNDPSMLIELAVNTGQQDIREQAVDRLLGIEPYASVWYQICQTDWKAAWDNALANACLACVARFGRTILRRMAANHATDQALLRWLYENDKDDAVRVNALVRIEDQGYLQAVFDAADSEDLRLCLAVSMRDTASAALLARTTKTPYICIKALRKTGDAAIAAEILGQTLYLAVCEVCAGMVNTDDITDDWRLGVLALCAPEDVRAQAADRIKDDTVFERIARRERSERFPVKHECETVSGNAVEYAFARESVHAFKTPESLRAVALNSNMPGKLRVEAARRITDEHTLLAVVKDADAPEVRREALRRITNIETLYCDVSVDMKRNFTREICTRMDELDADWPHRLDDAAVMVLVYAIAHNGADEKFDMRYIASVLKRIYVKGRLKTEIEGLSGRAIAHNDHHGKKFRHKACHNDEGYTYLRLDGLD